MLLVLNWKGKEEKRKEKNKKDLVNEAMTFIKESNAPLSLSSPKARIKSRGKHRIKNLEEGSQLRKEKINSKIFLEGSTRELIISCVPLLKGELFNPVVQFDLTSTFEKETVHKIITINCVPLEQNRKLLKFELLSQRLEMNGLVLKISGFLRIFLRGKKFFEFIGEASLNISREKESEENFLNGLSIANLRNIVQPFGIDFVYIAPGTFLMGSKIKRDEKPIHSIVLTKGFYMQTTEVTQLQWGRSLQPLFQGGRSLYSPSLLVQWVMGIKPDSCLGKCAVGVVTIAKLKIAVQPIVKWLI